jgi:SOS-response transcriptional repressor LexA
MNAAATAVNSRHTKTDLKSIRAALEAAPRQVELLRYIEKYTDKHGFPPSLQEMREHQGAASENAPLGAIKLMEQKGWVERPRHPETGRAIVRTLRITDIGRKVLKAAEK